MSYKKLLVLQRLFLKRFFPEHADHNIDLFYARLSTKTGFGCSCLVDLEFDPIGRHSVSKEDGAVVAHPSFDEAFSLNDFDELKRLVDIKAGDSVANNTSALRVEEIGSFASYLTPEALEIYSTRIQSTLLEVVVYPDGTCRPLTPADARSIDHRFVHPDGTERRVKLCVFYGVTVKVGNDWKIPDTVIKKTAEMFNTFVKDGKVKYGVVVGCSQIPLARVTRQRRAMLLLYPFSDFTRDQLNEYYYGKGTTEHYEPFIREGSTPPELPDDASA